MKKALFLLLACICYVSISFAQLEVYDNGKVGVGLSSNVVPLSQLTIGSRQGNTSALAYMFSTGQPYTLQISSDASAAGIYAEALSPGLNNSKVIAIHGVGGSETSTTDILGVGVRGVALRNGYGVSGLINNQVLQGAAIYGAVGSDEILSSNGRFAGYFDGIVKVTGYVNATIIGSSDIRYKKGISELNSEKSLKSILMMKPVEYSLEQQYVESIDKNEAIKLRSLYDEESQVFQKKHYGLIAQELQELYPDLVYEIDDKGHLGINYLGIIPMLIQSVQELSKEIEVLKNSKSAPDNVIGLLEMEEITATLYQNVPNPFNQSTEIKFYIPENSRNAQLCIYNLQGVQIKQVMIREHGESSYLLSASELTAGIYLYALIVDGKEVDIKRMILTE